MLPIEPLPLIGVGNGQAMQSFVFRAGLGNNLIGSDVLLGKQLYLLAEPALDDFPHLLLDSPVAGAACCRSSRP